MAATVEDLFVALDSVESDLGTVTTSVRLPSGLRDALRIAVEVGAIESITTGITDSLRQTLEDVALRLVLDGHYEQHPEDRPSLADLAFAEAQLAGNFLAEQPERLARAADWVEANLEPTRHSVDSVLAAASILPES